MFGYAPVVNSYKRIESIEFKKRLPRHFSRATRKERKILKKCLSWNPDSYMICTDNGLVDKIDTIYELEE